MSQWYGHPHVLNVPINKTVVIRVFPVTLILTLTQIAEIIWKGHAYISLGYSLAITVKPALSIPLHAPFTSPKSSTFLEFNTTVTRSRNKKTSATWWSAPLPPPPPLFFFNPLLVVWDRTEASFHTYSRYFAANYSSLQETFVYYNCLSFRKWKTTYGLRSV